MSSIASPRPSITLSSRRTSTSTTDTAVRSSSVTRAPGAQPRKNRAALRDYYNIKNAAPQPEPSESTSTVVNEDAAPETELDKPDFDAQKYVSNLLAKESLEGILRVEAGLLSDIRGFDGERKALVYDNYSKLIGATDTIRKMQTNMDPLAPTTSTLTPAVGHIVQTARSLSSGAKDIGMIEKDMERQKQRETVRWVLDARERLGQLLADGKKEEAHTQWARVSGLLDRWGGVQGAAEVKKSCEDIMRPQDDT